MKHCCEANHANYSKYGTAIVCCKENEDGSFWVSNDEYGTNVRFCPFCGKEAEKVWVYNEATDDHKLIPTKMLVLV
jgi:hypothetical protein